MERVYTTGPNGVVYQATGTSGGTLVNSAATKNFHDISIVPASVSPSGVENLYGSSDKTNGVLGFTPALPTTATGTSSTVLAVAGTDFSGNLCFLLRQLDHDVRRRRQSRPAQVDLSHGAWHEVATLAGNYVGLTGVDNGTTVSLYATTGTMANKGWNAGNSLISDTFTFNSGTSGTGTFGATTTLATATANSAFAGVQLLAPAPGALYCDHGCFRSGQPCLLRLASTPGRLTAC